MKLLHIAGLILWVVSGLICTETIYSQQLEEPADIVIYKLQDKTIAKVTGNDLLQKKWTIIAESKNSSEAIQKAIELIYNSYKDYHYLKAPCGKILVKKGTYDLGNEGIRFYYNQPWFVEGEGKDKTIFEYYGQDNAFGFKEITSPNPRGIFQAGNFSIRIKGDAKIALWVGTSHNNIILDNLKIVADKNTKPETGIFLDAGGGNIKTFRDISIIGPFEVGFKSFLDWTSGINLEVKDFRKYGIMTSGLVNFWGVKIYTNRKTAQAGFAAFGGGGGGIVYYLARTIYFKTYKQLDSFARCYGFTTVYNITDDSPFMENYTPFLTDGNYLHIGYYKVKKNYQNKFVVKNNGRIIALERQEFPEFIPDSIDIGEDTSPIDIIVFKEGETSAQILSENLAKTLGVKVGSCFITGKDEEVIQKALDILPVKGKIFIRKGSYTLPVLEIPWEKEITVEGQGCYRGTSLGTFKFKNTEKGGIAKFRMKNISIGGSIYAIKLENVNAILENIEARAKVGIVIENCDGCILKHIEGNSHFLDKGSGTAIIGPMCWRGAQLGPKCVLFGGHGGNVVNYARAVGKIGEKWRRGNGAIVFGLNGEGGYRYNADTAHLYLFGSTVGHPVCHEKIIGERNNGRVIILR